MARCGKVAFVQGLRSAFFEQACALELRQHVGTILGKGGGDGGKLGVEAGHGVAKLDPAQQTKFAYTTVKNGDEIHLFDLSLLDWCHGIYCQIVVQNNRRDLSTRR